MRAHYAAVASLLAATAAAHQSPWLIVPGKSLGRVSLGEQLAVVNSDLKAPNGNGDAAMGHFWSVWTGRAGHEVDVYSVRGENDSASHPDQKVRQIRTTSPAFKLADGLSVGSELSSLRSRYPDLKLAGQHRGHDILDSLDRGVAFEVTKNRCVAITVHEPGLPVLVSYLPFPG